MLGQGQGNENNKVNTTITRICVETVSHPASFLGFIYD